jgi:hypothetical protein
MDIIIFDVADWRQRFIVIWHPCAVPGPTRQR